MLKHNKERLLLKIYRAHYVLKGDDMIRIMVDSASDLRSEDGIFDYHMPLKVELCGVEYRDGVDIDADAFYEKLIATKEFPKTSCPAPQDFTVVFEEVKAKGDQLICFSLSSALSGTYQCAMLAKETVDYDGIYIIDTLAVTHMIGYLARLAVKMRDEGKSAREIVSACEELKKRIRIFAGADTLEYLRRGGRLNNASAFVGELVKIKPVVTVTPHGKVDAVGKCLGRAKAMKFIVDGIMESRVDESFPVYSLYSYGEENCGELEKKLAAAGVDIKGRLQVGSTIGAHVGGGVFGVVWIEKA